MNNWLGNALAAMLCWGLWAFFPKLSLSRISTASSVFYEACGVMATSLVVVFLLGPGIDRDLEGALYAVLTGIFGTVGLYFFFSAVKTGPISVISALTALYPVVTVVLAVVVLHERLAVRQVLGVLLALVAAALLSSRA
ncbi:MAG: EamA family transporter [Thermodesulfobacteria bacterium]|nr:EamA family transporter [Thermodesulfobacteriota bacterium]